MISGLILVAAVATLGDTPVDAPRAIEATPRVARAEQALEADSTLLDLHRSYLALLDSDPDLAATENVYNEVAVLSRFRQMVGAFEEAVAAQPKTRAIVYAYYASLNRNEILRRHADAIHRIGWSEAATNKGTLPALAYLRANPDTAIRFLENPALALPTPEALYSLRTQFRSRPELREELQGHFTSLHEEAEAHQSLFPAWKSLNTGQTDLAASYQDLIQYLARSPHYFWIYHRRMAKLAADPSTMEWIQHLHARIRRDPALRDTYFTYLQTLRREPARAEAAAARWNEAHGPAPAWPPEGRPPALDPIATSEPSVRRPDDPRTTFVMPTIPSGPTIGGREGIAFPKRPTRPIRPTRPEKEKPKESSTEMIEPDLTPDIASRGPRKDLTRQRLQLSRAGR